MSEREKGAHLTPERAAAFQLEGVVAAYPLRTPYPSGLAALLLDLAKPRGGRVLELGCGTGEIARMLAPGSERVDAIDISLAMIERAREMPSGDHAAIRWVHGPAETAPLDGPYALAVAGDSLHWMDLPTVMGRIADVLLPGAPLAIATAVAAPQPWDLELRDAIGRFSVIQDFQPYDFITDLKEQRLFEQLSEATIGPEPFTRAVEEYIDGLHATAGLPRERMGPVDSRAFDAEVWRIVERFTPGGVLDLAASARVVWGRPGQA